MMEQSEIASVAEATPEQEAETLPAAPSPPPRSIVREYFEQGLMTVVMALFLMTFIAQAVQVPTGSMQNNIHIGDHLFVNKFIFGRPTRFLKWVLPAREIRRGDVIVFKFPHDPKVNYVKRVIGLPGDRVWIRGTRVYVNDQELPEQRVTIRLMGPDYSAHPELSVEPPPPSAAYRVYYDDREHASDAEDASSATYGVKEAVTVPPDAYFALGDNRDNSLDSRYWGFVPRDNIIGRALYVYWSFNPHDPEYQGPENPLVRFVRQTDWRRTGRAIR